MLKLFSILSAFCWFFIAPAKADSFLLSQNNLINAEQEQIIPLVYIKNLEYYNHTQTAAFTKSITDKLSLEPKIIITDNEAVADYYIIPQLLQSKMSPLNQESSRYAMSVRVELWSKGGVLIDSAKQDRYIVIENTENTQAVAKKLLLKLLDEALTELMFKFKEKQFITG